MHRALLGLALALVLALPGPGYAQYAYPPPDAPPPDALPPGMPPPGAPAQALYAPPQLDQMLASIALYPDPLLTALLTASTYPLEVVQADRWVSSPENAALTDGALAAAVEPMDWDPSVKSLVPFPQVLHMLDAHLDWMQALGNAFLAQQADVMDSIQRLRHDALAAGTLRSTPQQAVIVAGSYIRIEPVNPDLVSIPVYNPTVVYGRWPYPAYLPIYYGPPPGLVYQAAPVGIGFGVGIVVVDVLWRWGHWDWSRHRIDLDRNRFNRLNAGRPPVAATVWRHDATRHASLERGPGGARPPLGATQPPRQANVPPQAAPSQGHASQPVVAPPRREPGHDQVHAPPPAAPGQAPVPQPQHEQRHEQARVPPPAAPAIVAPAAPVHPTAPVPPAVVHQEAPRSPPPQMRTPPPQVHAPQQPPAVQPMQQAPVQPMHTPVQPMTSSPAQPPQAAVVPHHAAAPPHPAAKPPGPPRPAEGAPPDHEDRHQERHE